MMKRFFLILALILVTGMATAEPVSLYDKIWQDVEYWMHGGRRPEVHFRQQANDSYSTPSERSYNFRSVPDAPARNGRAVTDAPWTLQLNSPVVNSHVTPSTNRQTISVTANGNLLNYEPWKKRKRSDWGRWQGGYPAVSVSRTSKSTASGYGNLSIGGSISQIAVSRSDGDVAHLADDAKDMTTSYGSGTGFGEVPHDDTTQVPLGDALLPLLLLITLYTLYLRRR